MTYSTGNLERDKIFKRAIRALVAGNEPLTLDALAAHVPADFDADAEELAGMLIATGVIEVEQPTPTPTPVNPMLNTTPDGRPLAPPKSLENIEPPRAAEPEPSPIATVEATPRLAMNNVEANRAILDAQNRLGNARIALVKARDNTKGARAALANAITVWQTGLPPYTPQDLIRDHLRSEQAKRKARIEAGVPAQVKLVGNSAVDRSAAYGRDNSPEGAVRSRMQTGSKRGAFPASMKFQTNYDPKRGPVGKLPSQR